MTISARAGSSTARYMCERAPSNARKSPGPKTTGQSIGPASTCPDTMNRYSMTPARCGRDCLCPWLARHSDQPSFPAVDQPGADSVAVNPDAVSGEYDHGGVAALFDQFAKSHSESCGQGPQSVQGGITLASLQSVHRPTWRCPPPQPPRRATGQRAHGTAAGSTPAPRTDSPFPWTSDDPSVAQEHGLRARQRPSRPERRLTAVVTGSDTSRKTAPTMTRVEQMWPDDWAERRAGEGCRICAQGRPERTAGGVRFFRGIVADAYLRARAPLPGYSSVIWRGRHIADLAELDAQEIATYWQEVARWRSYCFYVVFQPAQLNYLTFGNNVPHLHTYVLPRITSPVTGPPPSPTVHREAGAEIAVR